MISKQSREKNPLHSVKLNSAEREEISISPMPALKCLGTVGPNKDLAY